MSLTFRGGSTGATRLEFLFRVGSPEPWVVTGGGTGSRDVEFRAEETTGSDVAFVEPRAEDVQRRFNELRERWLRESALLTSTDASMLPSYQAIIGLGPAVVPLILRDLRETGPHWYWALKAITGADPVPRAARGHVEAMRQAWLTWGWERGLVKEPVAV